MTDDIDGDAYPFNGRHGTMHKDDDGKALQNLNDGGDGGWQTLNAWGCLFLMLE